MTQRDAGKSKTTQSPPVARTARARRRFSFTWLAPIAALILAGVLGYQVFQERGVFITISFPQAHGLAPEDAIMHRGLRVGTVRDVHLTADLQTVEVHAEIRRDAGGLTRQGTKFWIVRPQISLGEVSGLDTILGSRYIAVEPVQTAGLLVQAFEGLANAPTIEGPRQDALSITLRATRRGSITVGSPVFYRDITVGRIRDYKLSDDATAVMLTAEIDPRYAPLVHENSRFWNASGIGVDWGIFSGLSVQTDSLESLFAGGVAFATPSNRRMGEPVTQGHEFELVEKADEDWLGWEPEIPIDPATDLP